MYQCGADERHGTVECRAFVGEPDVDQIIVQLIDDKNEMDLHDVFGRRPYPSGCQLRAGQNFDRKLTIGRLTREQQFE